MNRKSFFRIYAVAAAAVFIILGVFLTMSYQQDVPEALSGTAADPRTFMSDAEVGQAKSYSFMRDWLFFAAYLWEWGILLWLLTSDAFRKAAARIERVVASKWLRIPIYAAAIGSIVFIWGLPVRFLGYTLSKSYGISTLPLPGWVRDQAIGLGLELALLATVSAVVFYMIRKGGAWWFRLWLLSIPFLLFLLYIRPVLIDPLYVEYKPLSDAALESDILAMAQQAGIAPDRVYEASFSERTNAINAYVDGIGASLRIVIWDTALQKLTDEEIMVMTAHEIGHYVMHHLEWSAVGSIGFAFLLLWIGSRIYVSIVRRWGDELGIRSASDWRALPLLLLLVSVLTFASTPFAGAVSREAERAADRFAYELLGDAEGAVNLFQKLAVSSLSHVQPARMSYWFRSTHPSLQERIVEAQSYDR